MMSWMDLFSKTVVTNWLLIMLIFSACYIANRLQELREAIESFNSDYLDGSGLAEKHEADLEE